MENSEADCRAFLARLHLYLDGEVAGAQCADIERHLAECEPCLKHAGFERELKQIVRRKCTGEPAPEGLAERLRARLRGLVEDV